MDGKSISTFVGTYRPTNVESLDSSVPENFSLEQNYPNPFNPVTKIKYSIPVNVKGETVNVKLTIYDLTGTRIATLVNKEQPPGEYDVEFNGSKLPSGIYFYVLNAGNHSLTKKMCLLK